MNEIVTAGMILSVMPIGEYDRRVEILSSDMGRISAFARGARKPGSALVSVTRVFAFGEFTLFQGKSSYTLKSAKITNYFDELTADIDDTYYGFYFLELAQYFSRENVEAHESLKLLYYSLRALKLKNLTHRLVKCIYELKILDLNGLCPQEERLFSGNGGYAYGKGVSAGCRKAYRYVLRSPVEKLFTFLLTESVLQEFEAVVQHLLDISVDRKFKSLPLIMDLQEII